MSIEDADFAIRARAFEYLAKLSAAHGDVTPFRPLSEGIEHSGTRVPLIGPQGIFKPRALELPLSITTSPDSPYDDAFTDAGFLRYRYRGSEPGRRDNVVLEEVDGPMLKHGLQEMHNRKLWVPSRAHQRPDPGALEERYSLFRAS